jgi:phosphoribosylglycinamide formyltransferase-1
MARPNHSFAFYCSDGASRVVKFYSQKENLELYPPDLVIYDGNREEVINTLSSLFEDRFLLFEHSRLNEAELYRIHTSTSQFIHSQLNKHSIDYLLCFGNKILKKELVNEYQNRLINFHPALLPSFKGLRAIDQALDYGAQILGNTVHYIDEGVDTGPIIAQTSMLREDFEDYEDVLELQFPLMKLVLRDILGFDIDDQEIIKELSHRKKPFLLPKSVAR